METKFKPGPWECRQPFNQERFALYYGETGRTKRLDDLKGGFSESDARLIAAAPALYAALVKARETIEALHGPVAWDIYDRASPEMKAINGALARARGES